MGCSTTLNVWKWVEFIVFGLLFLFVCMFHSTQVNRQSGIFIFILLYQHCLPTFMGIGLSGKICDCIPSKYGFFMFLSCWLSHSKILFFHYTLRIGTCS